MCCVQCVIFVVTHYTLHTIHYRNTVHTKKVNTTQYTLHTNCQKNTRYTKYSNYTVHSTHYRLHSTHLLVSLLHSTQYTVPKLHSTQYTCVSQIPASLSIFWKHKINNFVFTIFCEIFSHSGTFKHDFGQIIPSIGSTHSHISCFYLSGNKKTTKLPILNILRPYQRISILSKMLISVNLDTPMALQAHTTVGFIFSEV